MIGFTANNSMATTMTTDQHHHCCRGRWSSPRSVLVYFLTRRIQGTSLVYITFPSPLATCAPDATSRSAARWRRTGRLRPARGRRGWRGLTSGPSGTTRAATSAAARRRPGRRWGRARHRSRAGAHRYGRPRICRSRLIEALTKLPLDTLVGRVAAQNARQRLRPDIGRVVQDEGQIAAGGAVHAAIQLGR